MVTQNKEDFKCFFKSQFNSLYLCKLRKHLTDPFFDDQGILSSTDMYFVPVDYYKVISSEVINK